MIRRTSGIAVLASLTVVLTMEASTSALCQLDDPYDLWWEPDQDTIYVKVNANMEEICIPHGGTSDCADLDDVVRTIRVALDEFNDNAAANIRFAYWGITYAAVGAKLPGYVHIFRDPNYGAAAAHTVLNDDDDNDYADACRIYWNHSDPDLEGAWTFRSMESGGYEYDPGEWINLAGVHDITIHELMHCLGFAHNNEDCLSDRMSVTNQGNPHKNHLFKEDIAGLQAVYGFRTATATVKESSTMASWLAGPNAPTQANSARCRFGVSNNAWFYTYASYPIASSTDRVQITRNDGTSWSYVTQLSSAYKTVYHTATVAPQSVIGEVVVAYLGNYSLTSGLQDLLATRSTNYGSTWGTPVQLTSVNQRTRSLGVAGTYDPEEDVYVLLTRASTEPFVAPFDHEYIRQTVWRRVDNTVDHSDVEWPDGVLLRSADSPAIACGLVSVVGAENCLMTWSTHQWDRSFYWVQGHVECVPGIWPDVDCEFVFDDADVYAHPVIIYGQAAVAYTGNSTWPWVMTYHQGGSTVYSMKKGPAGDWVAMPYQSSGRTVSPSVGSRAVYGGPQETDLYWHGW